MPKEEQSAGGANARNVWTIATQPFRGAHFATFPPELPRRCILAGSRPGDTVFDPFAGSGTTLLVADQLGRHAIGIEMNPAYADLARRRITDNAPLFADVAVSERGTDGTETVRTSAAQTQLRFDQPEHTT
jgi:site-specific DNA-methyltransferase (adenine-specific)